MQFNFFIHSLSLFSFLFEAVFDRCILNSIKRSVYFQIFCFKFTYLNCVALYCEYREKYEGVEIKSDDKDEDTKIRTLMRRRMLMKMFDCATGGNNEIMMAKHRMERTK